MPCAAILAASLFFGTCAGAEQVIGLGSASQIHHESLREELMDKLYATGIPRSDLERIFGDPRSYADLIPVRPMKSDLYSQASIRRGLVFLETYQPAFELARAKFGVSPYVIASILRNETNFGKYPGKNLVVTTLYWLYVLSPEDAGQQTAVNRLGAFIRSCEQNNWNILGIKGSADGAFGLPQFMPGTFQELAQSRYRYLIDSDHDGKIDLSKPSDAILAVAWLFSVNGWGERAAHEKRAIYLYNHDWTYVHMVVKYALLLKQAACVNDNVFHDQNCYDEPHRIIRRTHRTHNRRRQ